MKILVTGFDWDNLARTDPEALLRKLRRDHINIDGHDVLLWGFGPEDGAFMIAPRVTAVRRKAYRRLPRPLHDLRARSLLVHDLHAHHFSPDAVVIYDFPLLPAARRVRRAFGSKILLFLTNLPTDLAGTRRGSRFRAAYHRHFERMAPYFVDLVCAISEATKSYALSIGMPAERIALVAPDTLSADADYIKGAKKGILRSALGIPETSKVILSVGRLEPEKGFERLLHAFSELGRKDTVLVIAGEGRLRRELNALADKLDIGDRVHFPGFVPRSMLWNYFADADAFMLLSRSEALGLVVWEAMRARVPVIVSGAGGLRETVGADETRGFLWKEEDGIAVLSEKLDRCFGRGDIEPMLERAYAYVVGKMATEDIADILRIPTAMKLLYATSIVYPSQLGNRLQIMAMAKEFGRLLGVNFTLGALTVRGGPVQSVIEMGGTFRDTASRSPMLAWRYISIVRKRAFTHVLCREEKLFVWMRLYALLKAPRTRFFFEAHRLNIVTVIASRLATGVIAISNGVADDLAARGVLRDRILIAPDAVDIARFEGLPERTQLRREMGFGENEKIVLYLGSFDYYYSWKGVDTLLAAAPHAPAGTRFVLVGGKENEIALLRERFPGNPATLLPFCPPEEAPRYWRAADVLVLPNKKGARISERHTSPLKLFEYMASGTPILASDLPSIREIVSEREVAFFEPNDPASLIRGLESIFAHPDEARTRAERASELARRFTWEKRANSTISFMRGS